MGSNAAGSNKPRSSRTTKSPTTDDETVVSPTLNNAISAFQSAGFRKRAMTNGSDEINYQRERQQEIEQETARQQRIREKMPGRQPTKARAGDIDAVLDQVRDGWEFMFNTVDLALQLLDENGANNDMDSFRRTKVMLSQALKGSVDEHFKQFADALPHHAALIGHLNVTQKEIKETRTALQGAKESLGSKRSDLVQLWSRGQTLDEMMKILDQIEHLKSVPDLLETLISEKRLLQASVLLVRSLKMISKPDMLDIGALTDLRNYLSNQETTLKDILIDELHNHLFLKSFWCESRWAAYVPNQIALPSVEYDEEQLDGAKTSQPRTAKPNASHHSRLKKYLNDLAIRPNDPPLDINEPNINTSRLSVASMATGHNMLGALSTMNPESDSFMYMETLMEALAVLGKLGNALDNVTQRLSSELFTLVEATLDEVNERAEYGRRVDTRALSSAPMIQTDGVFVHSHAPVNAGSPLCPSTVDASALRLSALESSARRLDHETLNDLFWTLYSKLDAVAQGFRIVYEVASRIGSRRDFKDASGAKAGTLFPLSEIWTSVQTEVRTLISEYINDEQQGTSSARNPVSSINEILREGKFIRDKSKPIFRFTDTDVKLAIKSLKPYEDELMGMIKDTMPGLVQATAENPTQSITHGIGADDRLLGSGHRHRVLVHPDAFHVTILFRPTLCFLDRVADILPFDAEATASSSEVLDEFVLNVYLPQLEEKVSFLFHQIVTGPEAFQPDAFSARLSREPLLRASIHLMGLINSLCAMLQTSPFHRENYSRLILGVIIQFYQRCSDRFQDLVTVAPPRELQLEPRLALAAQWAQRSEIGSCLAELQDSPEADTERQDRLGHQEINIELDLLGQDAISNADLVPSLRSLTSLCTLHRSVTWFTAALSSLKNSVDGAPMSPQNLEPLSALTPFSPNVPIMPPISGEDGLKLPLSKEMALRYQALLKTFEQLAELILFTIRIDVRCRVISHLGVAFRNGNYFPDRESTDPDPNIALLNTELTQCEELISAHLPTKSSHFVFSGLDILLEQQLIANAHFLSRVNSLGVNKLVRNIQALQQNIRAIAPKGQNIDFKRAKQYYSLFHLGPQGLLDSIRKEASFTFEEYQTMLNLQCGVVSSEGEAGIARAVDRNYNVYMIELHGMELGA
ncbi:hypothetical protein ONZ45_g8399 [Pleurotus djamor]|nr:hypothetical protein ONZ45_g8399 [Pleurotus djamor]